MLIPSSTTLVLSFVLHHCLTAAGPINSVSSSGSTEGSLFSFNGTAAIFPTLFKSVRATYPPKHPTLCNDTSITRWDLDGLFFRDIYICYVLAPSKLLEITLAFDNPIPGVRENGIPQDQLLSALTNASEDAWKHAKANNSYLPVTRDPGIPLFSREDGPAAALFEGMPCSGSISTSAPHADPIPMRQIKYDDLALGIEALTAVTKNVRDGSNNAAHGAIAEFASGTAAIVRIPTWLAAYQTVSLEDGEKVIAPSEQPDWGMTFMCNQPPKDPPGFSPSEVFQTS